MKCHRESIGLVGSIDVDGQVRFDRDALHPPGDALESFDTADGLVEF